MLTLDVLLDIEHYNSKEIEFRSWNTNGVFSTKDAKRTYRHSNLPDTYMDPLHMTVSGGKIYICINYQKM